MSAGRTVIANVHKGDGAPIDVVIEDGVIAAVGPDAGAMAGEGAQRIDGAGGLITRSFVDGHVHLDKTLLGLPFIPHIPGNKVSERIAAEKHLRRTIEVPVEVRGGRMIELIAAYGTGAVRSHADIDTEIGLRNLEAELALKESHADLIDVQIVAFPQSGILADPGALDLLHAAMANGANLIGGLDPAGIDRDVTGHLDAVFEIAERHGAGVDIHLHDGGALGAFELRQIAERTLALGIGGQVVVSHAYCLGELSEADFGQTSEALARAGVAIMTTAPGPVPMPPVKRLMAAGVTVFSGTDNLRDAWSPFGNGDLLERAGLICDRQWLNDDDDLELAFSLTTAVPARVLGLDEITVEAGDPADLMVLPAGSIAEAVAVRPGGRKVFKRGRLVAENGVLLPR